MASLRARSVSIESRQSAPSLGPSRAPDEVFLRVFRRLGLKHGAPDFQIEYRPFASLRSRIELRGNRVRVYLSDLLQEAPVLVLEGLAEILLGRLFRRRASREARECYMAYVFDPAVRERLNATRRKRGRVRLLPARGRHFDLERIFARLKERFFNGELAACRIGWSPNGSRTILGRYDPAHRTIAISRVLDAPSVPGEVVDYLVFHEMLHIQFPLKRRGDRRVVHSREFREAEKRFPHYRQARERLKKLFLA
jgi:SprT-like family